MTISITHAKVSTIPDDATAQGAGEVLASDWNAAHIISGTLDGATGATGLVGATGLLGPTGASLAGATGATGSTGAAPFSIIGNDAVYSDGSLVVPKTSGVGLKVDAVSPTFGWADLLAPIQTRTAGGTVPAFSAYQGTLFQFSFGTAGGNVEVFTEYHIPHDYLPNSDVLIHAHWSTIAAPTGNVNWLFDLSYAKGYGQAPFEGTTGTALPITVSVTAPSVSAFQHEISEVQCSAANGLIDPASINVSITSGAAILTAVAPLFTEGDIGRTVTIIGAGVASANLQTSISAFTSTTIVTLANNASTTVTTQNAFRYRVLDSALLQVDGLILARGWRNASRAADTLNVAPFLHFVDVHYQTSGMIGTKQRNGPNFYT